MMGISSPFSGVGLMLGLAGLVIGIYIFVRAVQEHRDQQLGGYISFGRAFVVVLLAVIISTLASTLFNYLYFNFINPSAVDTLLETIGEMYEKLGLSEEIIEQTMEQQRAAFKSPMSIITSGLFGGAVGGSIIGLIMAAIMKRDRPKFT
jgi:predicted PurR-regulated permease PerM